MNLPSPHQNRLHFLARVTEKEASHLQATDSRLFSRPLDAALMASLEQDVALSEQVDAFVSRFSRLQDTLGDKLLPLYLMLLGEPQGAVIDNLNKAEKLGLIDSAEQWMSLRYLRNQMVHEYIEDSGKLAAALNLGHGNVSTLIGTARRILADIERRGWYTGASHARSVQPGS